MREESKKVEEAGATQGGHRPSAVTSAEGVVTTGLAPEQRWSAARKREVVLRMLRDESVEALSRELGVEIYRLEKWRDKGFSGIDAALKEREGDPVQAQLSAAMGRIGVLTMLCQRVRKPGPSGDRPHRAQSRCQAITPGKRGPKPVVPDAELLELIPQDLASSPFTGEGHRKVWGGCTSGKGCGCLVSECFDSCGRTGCCPLIVGGRVILIPTMGRSCTAAPNPQVGNRRDQGVHA